MIVDSELLNKIEDNPYAYKENSPRQTREFLEKWQRGLIRDIDAVDRENSKSTAAILDQYKRSKVSMLARVNLLIDIME